MYSAHSNVFSLALSHNYGTLDSTRIFGHFDHEAPHTYVYSKLTNSIYNLVLSC
jgi:hypothetical protein